MAMRRSEAKSLKMTEPFQIATLVYILSVCLDGFDAFGPQHEYQRLATCLWRVCCLSVHPNQRASWISSIFIPDFTFEHDVGFSTGMAVRHESINGDFRVRFIQHQRASIFTVQASKSNTGAEVFPANVFFEPSFVDVKSEPIRHVVGEGHVSPKWPYHMSIRMKGC